jgi:hypothetical protein
LYDADETGIKSMARLVREYKDFGLKSLLLPLSGHKSEKDVSDFFRLGNNADDLMMLFREMLDELYQETIAVMRICAINFDNPPPAPDPLLSVGEVTIGSPGNLVCIAGSEGSGKTNYLGGILSGAIRPGGIEIDTLGATVRENIRGSRGAAVRHGTVGVPALQKPDLHTEKEFAGAAARLVQGILAGEHLAERAHEPDTGVYGQALLRTRGHPPGNY